MTLPNATCPDGLTLYNLNGISACFNDGSFGACPSLIFPSYQHNYSKVCGQVRGYKYGSPDAIHGALSGQGIDGQYADGVLITYYDSSPRKHIWSYIGARLKIKRTLINAPVMPASHSKDLHSLVITIIVSQFLNISIPVTYCGMVRIRVTMLYCT